MPAKKIKKTFSRFDIMALVIILIVAFGFRLYKIDTPLADWHSWRQVDTASVARNYVQDGFNLLYPRYDDLSSIQSGEYNPEGYRFVEFPLYNSIFGLLYKYFPVVPLHVYGRLVSAIFSLITIGIVYYLVRREENTIAAITASSVMAAFPFMVYYSRVVLPEMTALSMVFIAILFLYLWKDSQKHKTIQWTQFGLSAAFAAMAILIKPTAIFYFLVLGYFFLQKYRRKVFTKAQPYLYFAIAIVPFLLWRYWISQFPEGIPGFDWLITSVNTYEGQKNVFFRPAFFRWIFYERILLLIMGGYAAGFTFLGVIKKQKTLLFYAIGASALAYLLTFQGGNVQHDYYQTLIFPALAIFTGLGVSHIFTTKKAFANKLLSMLVVIAVLGFSAAMSYYQVKGYYNYSSDLVSVGKLIDTLTPQDALVVTDRSGDTTLLYLANRRGMPAVVEDLEVLRDEHGMEYFVTDKPDVAEQVGEIFDLIFENDSIFIFKL